MSRAAERALPVYLQTLKQSENLGEEVLADQQQIVELDKRRQATREAIRAVRREKEARKMWVMMGDEFVKVEKGTLQDWLESDQSVLDKEIDSVRDGLKEKVQALKRLEGEEIPRGFFLNSMSKDELSNISSVGRVKERYLDDIDE